MTNKISVAAKYNFGSNFGIVYNYTEKKWPAPYSEGQNMSSV